VFLSREAAKKEASVTSHTEINNSEDYLISEKLDSASPSKTDNAQKCPTNASMPTDRQNSKNLSMTISHKKAKAIKGTIAKNATTIDMNQNATGNQEIQEIQEIQGIQGIQETQETQETKENIDNIVSTAGTAETDIEITGTEIEIGIERGTEETEETETEEIEEIGISRKNTAAGATPKGISLQAMAVICQITVKSFIVRQRLHDSPYKFKQLRTSRVDVSSKFIRYRNIWSGRECTAFIIFFFIGS
jgi:hypothetical protein